MELNSLLEPVVEAAGYELLLADYVQGQKILRIYIDRTDGEEVTIDDCAEVSHQLSGVLDVEDPIPEEYSLEVSSPGLDRPLTKPAHFQQFAGNEVKIQLHRPLDGRRRYRGVLLGADENEITVVVDNEEFCLPLQEIERARLVPQFN